ncbi:AI-2E family transporter [Caldovatus sediminis]|nr:AI-2E family transporter [Caldovatus sediminis]
MVAPPPSPPSPPRPEAADRKAGPPPPPAGQAAPARGGARWPPAPPAGGGPRTATPRQRLGLVLGLLGALLFGVWLFQSILTPFVLAGVIAYFLDPPATRLARLGVPRGLAALLLVLALVLFALLCLLLLWPLVIAQIGVLVASLPAYIARVGAALRDALLRIEEAVGPAYMDTQLRELAVNQVGAMLAWLGTAATRLLGGGVALFNVFTLVVVTPIVAFYLLRDWPRILARIESWLPRRSANTIRQLARDTDRVLSAWLRGQLLCCTGLGVYYAVGLSLAGLELGLMVGLLSGILTFIPYVGSTTGLVLATLLSIGQFGTWQEVAVVVAVFVAGQIVEGYIIYPYLLGDRVELHAVWVIFALFAGGVAFGFLGVLLAVPMAATIGVVARYWLRRYLESPLYLDPPRTGT